MEEFQDYKPNKGCLFANYANQIAPIKPQSPTQNTRYQPNEFDQTTVRLSISTSSLKYSSHEISRELINYNLDDLSDGYEERWERVRSKKARRPKQKTLLDEEECDADVSEVRNGDIQLVSRSIFNNGQAFNVMKR